ncbi:Uncharacterised protein [Escherichia coli]|nr:Uncharacterised protein [Escherichia coli]
MSARGDELDVPAQVSEKNLTRRRVIAVTTLSNR